MPMEHHPDITKPKDVETFNIKDRKIAFLIDETLADYEAHKAAMQPVEPQQ